MKPLFFLSLIFLFFLPIFFVFTLGQVPETAEIPAKAEPATQAIAKPALPNENSTPGLRQLAEKRGILLGTAVSNFPLGNDPTYQQVLTREFSMLVPENAMKFEVIHPQKDVFDFQEVDQLFDFAEAHQMQFRHHPLLWDEQLPPWLVRGNFSREELMAILKEHIQTIVKRYQGKVKYIDVANEVIARDGTLKDTLWLRGIGPEYIDLSFIWTHEVAPEAKLFINEFSAEEVGIKASGVASLAEGLQQRGVPIHGVGLQMHRALNNKPNLPEVAKNLENLRKLGLEAQITEMDVALSDKSGADHEAQLQEQAQIYGDTVKMCGAAKNCTAIVFWGFSDRYTWMTSLLGRGGNPLIFDESFQPKPAYQAVKAALEGRN